ncbi:MAG: glycosyltransferase family 2 protein, partial [Flavicella sp.]
YTNWEMLITDDGSSDNSVEIVKAIAKVDPRVKIFPIKNSGPANARNNSIKQAQGSYMAFLDSDDLWYPEFIEKSIAKVKDSEGFVYASYKRCDELTLEPTHVDFIVPEKVNYHDILKTNSISCLTAFIDIDRLGKKLMPEVQYRQDMGLWVSYLKEINYAYGIKEPLAIYRIRSNSHSRNKKKLLKPQWYFYRHVEKASVLKSLYYMIVWAYYGYMKYRK